MTWLKLPDEFADDCGELSDAAFRTHVEGLLWVMKRERGPEIRQFEIHRFASTADPAKAIDELVRAGRWSPAEGGFRIVDLTMTLQPEPDEISRRRAADADRQRRTRRRKAGFDEP